MRDRIALLKRRASTIATTEQWQRILDSFPEDQREGLLATVGTVAEESIAAAQRRAEDVLRYGSPARFTQKPSPEIIPAEKASRAHLQPGTIIEVKRGLH